MVVPLFVQQEARGPIVTVGWRPCVETTAAVNYSNPLSKLQAHCCPVFFPSTQHSCTDSSSLALCAGVFLNHCACLHRIAPDKGPRHDSYVLTESCPPLCLSAACCCSPLAAVTCLQTCRPSCGTMQPAQQTSTSRSSQAASSMGATAETCSALRSAGSGTQTSSAGSLLCLVCRAPAVVSEHPVQIHTRRLWRAAWLLGLKSASSCMQRSTAICCTRGVGFRLHRVLCLDGRAPVGGGVQVPPVVSEHLDGSPGTMWRAAPSK